MDINRSISDLVLAQIEEF